MNKCAAPPDDSDRARHQTGRDLNTEIMQRQSDVMIGVLGRPESELDPTTCAIISSHRICGRFDCFLARLQALRVRLEFLHILLVAVVQLFGDSHEILECIGCATAHGLPLGDDAGSWIVGQRCDDVYSLGAEGPPGQQFATP